MTHDRMMGRKFRGGYVGRPGHHSRCFCRECVWGKDNSGWRQEERRGWERTEVPNGQLPNRYVP